MKIIILAGGGGTRLFPLSCQERPKQFLAIDSEKSLLSETIERFSDIVSPENIVIVTGQKYIEKVKKELKYCHAEKASIVAEPMQRNTAPAIALAVQYCQEVLHSPADEVMFISTSDHIIRPKDAFNRAVLKSVELAGKGKFVTFGIHPNKAETGFGYIEVEKELNGAYITKGFKEKPDALTAEKYLMSGRFYWNSGMFAFTGQTYLQEINRYAPMITDVLKNGYEVTIENFSDMPDISIDYAVAEKSKVGMTVPLTLYWSDVGSWDAVYDILPKDENGNAIKGNVLAVDCKNNLFLSDKQIITGADVSNLVLIEKDNIIMITQRGSTQKVKKIVEQMKLQKQDKQC